MSCSRASFAARSESSMNTMALTEETARRTLHSRMLFVVKVSRPQSSAFTIRKPAGDVSPVLSADWLAGESSPDDSAANVTEESPDRTKVEFNLLCIASCSLSEGDGREWRPLRARTKSLETPMHDGIERFMHKIEWGALGRGVTGVVAGLAFSPLCFSFL